MSKLHAHAPYPQSKLLQLLLLLPETHERLRLMEEKPICEICK